MGPDARARRATVLALVVIVGVTALVGAIALPSTAGLEAVETADLDEDATIFDVTLHEDGSATWTIEHRYRLDSDEREGAFEELAADIEANQSTYVERFESRMSPTITSAEDRTDREMALGDVSITAETRTLPQEYGILRTEFTWAGFAATDGSTVVAGDALGGFFIEEDQRLRYTYPSSYHLESASPEPDDRGTRSVTWHGPAEFDPDGPSVRVSPEQTGLTDDVPGGAVSIVAVVGVTVLAAAGAVVGWRRRGAGPSTSHREHASAESVGLDGPATGAGGTDDGTRTTAAERPPDELLSSEERVLRFLEDRGGRAKQQELVAAFDWTDARASQVVSALREDGTVETFRIGRENVVVLTGDDGPGSPLDDVASEGE